MIVYIIFIYYHLQFLCNRKVYGIEDTCLGHLYKIVLCMSATEESCYHRPTLSYKLFQDGKYTDAGPIYEKYLPELKKTIGARDTIVNTKY